MSRRDATSDRAQRRAAALQRRRAERKELPAKRAAEREAAKAAPRAPEPEAPAEPTLQERVRARAATRLLWLLPVTMALSAETTLPRRKRS